MNRRKAISSLLCMLAILGLGCSRSSTESFNRQSARQGKQSSTPGLAGRISRAGAGHAKASTKAAKKTSDRRTETPGLNDVTKVQHRPFPPLELTSDEISDGWIQLFDGVSLFGWRTVDEDAWTVEDGRLVVRTSEASQLVTTTPFADFELRLQVRADGAAKAAVLLRCASARPTRPGTDCWLLDLPVAERKTLPSREGASGRKRTEVPKDDSASSLWQDVVIQTVGRRVSLSVGDRKIAEQTMPDREPLRCGFVGLAVSGGEAAFRRIHLRPLGLQPLWNGQDLSGWRVVPGSHSRFVVQDGVIHVENGPGFLETEDQWADFVLQFEARTNGRELNSGVFFRAMPGTAEAPSNGYEVQIHNGFQNGDRSRPSNAGTGAIFRRTTARWVVSDDYKWFTVTLVAAGAHFSVWVNGLQVTDWTDTRAKNENPRRGLRLAAGHISLQGHDPTTNLDFRRLRLAVLPVLPR